MDSSLKIIPHNVEKIPRILWMTWHTKELPPKMKENIELLKKQHQTLEFRIFDIQMCRTFIKTQYGVNCLDAYDSLIPYAFNEYLR